MGFARSCFRGLVGALALVSSAAVGGAAEQAEMPLEGRVVWRSGGPVSGAVVTVSGRSGSVVSDSDGRFVWTPAPPVPFQAVVILPGGEVAKPVVIDSLQNVTITVDALADETVSVLGVAPSIDATPAAGTTMLSATHIARRTPENLMQALETVAGVNQVSEGHAAVPAMRGLARGRTLLLIDGARVTSERRIGPSATFVDPSVADGIDVSRGPGGVAYGSDAFGGVISVRTRRAEQGSPLRARFTGTAGAGVPEQRGTFEVSKGLTNGGVLFQAHVRNAEDYDSPEGEVFNSGWEDQGFLINGHHRVGPGHLSVAWQGDFARDFERPRNNSSAVRFYYPYENSHRVTTTYAVPDVAGFKQFALTGFFGSIEQRTDQDRFPTATMGRTIERADMSAQDFHVKGTAERILGTARLELGVDVNGRFGLEALDINQAHNLSGTLTQDNVNVSVEDAHRLDTAAFLQAEVPAGPLARLTGGVRVDRVSTENVGGYFGDRSTSHGAASGFGAVTVGPFQHLSVTAQVARGFRDPTLSDRYFRGPSGRGFITGNPDLDPETSLQFDLAAHYTLPRTQLAAYFYEYRITDLVERFETETDFFFFRNRGRARLRGFEVEARSELGRGYSVEVATQIARGVALDDDANLDDISPITFSVLGRKDLGRGYAQTRLAVQAKDDRPGPSEIAAPGATLWDLGGGWRVLPNLELRGLARNLLDEAYYASPDPRWVWAPGRSANLTVVVTF
jgi:outer membrane receptor protein involved in Fe transport